MSAPIICVHQVGKVGSTSVVEALRRLLPAQPIHQTHVLHERALLAAIANWLRQSRRSPGRRLPWNVAASIALSRELETGPDRADWFLLSLVRDPVGRNISDFFENLRHAWVYHLPLETRAECLRLLKPKAATPEPDLVQRIAVDLVALFHGGYTVGLMDRWFDQEAREGFGVDVFAEPFALDQGFAVVRRGRVRWLTLRLESLAASFAPAVRDWLGDGPFASAIDRDPEALEIRRANEAGHKNYALLHQQFLKLLRFDPHRLEAEYASRTARHFYSGEERARFLAKWSRPADESPTSSAS